MKEVKIIGNLGADAKITEKDGNCYLSFTMAHTQRHRDSLGNWGDLTTWYSVTKLDAKKYLEKLQPYLLRGSKVHVSGDFVLKTYKEKAEMSILATSIFLINSTKERDHVKS